MIFRGKLLSYIFLLSLSSYYLQIFSAKPPPVCGTGLGRRH